MDNIDIEALTVATSHLRTPGQPARTPFRIRTLGKVVHQSAHLTRGTYFDDAMLMWVQAGRGRYVQGCQTLPVGPGMLGMVLPEGDPGYLQAEPTDPYTHIYCRFAGDEALRMAREIRRRMSAPFVVHLAGVEVGALLEAMLAEEGSQQPGSESAEFMSAVETMLARVLATLLRPPALSGGRPRLGREKLSAYILDNLHRPVSLDRTAAHFGLSRAHLCREAKRLLGMPFQKAAEREKLIWAATLLRDRTLDLNVSEAAYRVGYADPLYFSKVFKRHHGISPSSYRA